MLHRDAKKPLKGSTVNSEESLLFSNIIGLKYENGLSCDLFLAETQLCSYGLYQIRQNTVSTELRVIRPKIFGNFQFTKNFNTQEIRRKSRQFTPWTHENALSILERIWWRNHHFIIEKNKRLDTRSRKPNYEIYLVAIIL